MARRTSSAPDLSHIAEALRPLAVDISTLNPDPANARLHNEANLTAIKASLTRFGQDQPLVVQRAGMIVRKGNGRLEAAKALGWTHVAAVIVDDSDWEAVARALADNRTAELATWDTSILSRLMVELDAAGVETGDLGWTPGEVVALVATPEPVEAVAPDDFASYDESIPIEHQCPKCGYKFSGGEAKPDAP